MQILNPLTIPQGDLRSLQIDAPATSADGLKTTTGVVDTASAVPPTTGQVLTATSPTSATWQNIPLAANISPLNRDMPALTTSADGSVACATALLSTPPITAWVVVAINGVQAKVGNGTKSAPCYFSADSGTTARATGELTAGDILYWNGSVAGYQLVASVDRIDIIFEAV